MNPSDQVIERVVELLRKVEQKIAEIAGLINRALAALPAAMSFIADQVQAKWNSMMVGLGNAWAAIVDWLSYAGNPAMLLGASSGWTTMGAKVAGLNNTLNDFDLSVDDSWTGRAAEQYKQSIEPQRRANTSIMSDYAQNIGNAMSSLAGGIIAFWVGIALAVVSLLGALAGAAVATGTIIGLPAAPVIMAIGIAAMIVTAGGGVLILLGVGGGAKTTINSALAGITAWPPIAAS